MAEGKRKAILARYLDKVVGLEKGYFKISKLLEYSIEMTIEKDFTLMSVLSAFHKSYVYGGLSWNKMIVYKLANGKWSIDLTIAKDPLKNQVIFKIVT